MRKTILFAALLIATVSFGQKVSSKNQKGGVTAAVVNNYPQQDLVTVNQSLPKDSTAKQPVDTLVQTTWRLNDLRSFINAIERSVDSKSLSREMIDMLSRNSQILQPADKPKEVAKPKQ